MPKLLRPVVILAFAFAFATRPSPVAAHGLFGHVHVTGYAVENLPPGELKDLFADPANFDAALMGATFPDTGYAVATNVTRDYGEAAHWEPFIEAMIVHIRATYGPTYDTPEERRLIAFVMGMASHGQQDELYDTTFDLELIEREGVYESDTYVDGFFAHDGHARLYPTGMHVPFGDLLNVYTQTGQTLVTEEIIQHQIDVVLNVYMNDGFGRDVATAYGETYRASYPWTSGNYFDPSVPGSFRAEIAPDTAYLQTIWDRLHDRFEEEDLVIHAWPDSPRRLRSSDHTRVASYVTVAFGIGVKFPTVSASLVDENGQPHPFVLANTRWSTEMTRVVQFRATTDYVPGGHYVARIEAGAERIDGQITTQVHEVPFQVECAAPDEATCPTFAPVDDPVTDGSRHVLPRAKARQGCGVVLEPIAGSSLATMMSAAIVLVTMRRRRRARVVVR